MADLLCRDSSTALAELLRPKTRVELIGQRHLFAANKSFALAFAAKKGQAMILSGLSKVAKTTLAWLTAVALDGQFMALSAAFLQPKDIRAAIVEAALLDDKHRILWVDELYRFNRLLKLFIKQLVISYLRQLLVLPRCSRGKTHG